MLFRTVYGPELQTIYSYVLRCAKVGEPTGRTALRSIFLLQSSDVSTQSIDDALTFLISSGLLIQQESYLQPTDISDVPFPLKLLSACRNIELDKGRSDLDTVFSSILSEI